MRLNAGFEILQLMIIGIGGVSRAGKSSLAKELVKCFPGQKIAVLHQDEYIKAGYNIPLIKEQIDWEDPESIDFHRLMYDFHWLAKHVDILIHEGLFAYFNEDLNKLYDKKFLIEIDFKNFYTRKKEDLRWGLVPEWYIDHIWESYVRFGKPDDLEDVMILPGDKAFEMDKILDFIGESVHSVAI